MRTKVIENAFREKRAAIEREWCEPYPLLGGADSLATIRIRFYCRKGERTKARRKRGEFERESAREREGEKERMSTLIYLNIIYYIRLLR